MSVHVDTSYLRGEYVYLEHLHPDHIPALKKSARDERIWEYTKTLLIDDAFDEHFDKYISLALDENAFGGQQAFVIHQTSNDEVIGMTRMLQIDPKEKRLEIGHTWYTPHVWGKVHNKECKLLLLQYAFEKLHFNRVEFRVAHQNLRSQKAVEKIGGVKEGVLRKHAIRGDGSLRDTVVFSILSDEWPAKKEELLRLIATAEK